MVREAPSMAHKPFLQSVKSFFYWELISLNVGVKADF